MKPFVFFGGKGGVGKTTVSCAYAKRSADDGVKTLVVSTDPAHSVSDVFDQQFTDAPQSVAGIDGLSALEIDPQEVVDEHFQTIRNRLSDQVSPAMVNQIDAQLEMAHQTPGAHEAALFDRFVDVIRDSDRYDRIVFDTAPTGATIRLLALPDPLESWIGKLSDKRRKSIDLFEKAGIGDQTPRRQLEDDPVLEHLKQRKEFFEFAGEVLRTDTAFFFVLNPDQLSVEETARALEDMDTQNLDVYGLIANQLTPHPETDEGGAGIQYLRDRVATEQDRIERIRDQFDPPLLAEIETRTEEVKGELLADVAAELEIETHAEEPKTV